MQPLGVGLIGYGGFGRFIGEAIGPLLEVRVIAVADPSPEALAQAAQRLGAAVYPDPVALLADPAVDLVVISTPPASHASLAIAAARAGKHVFCEKPLATTLADADAAIAAAAENHVRLMVDFVLRHNPLNQRIITLLRSGVLGSLHHLSLENWATDEALKPGHWFWDPRESGGIWVEHGVHFFDLFAHFCGQNPLAAVGAATTRPDGCRDRVWSLVSYTGGVKAAYHHAFTQPARFEQTTIRLAAVRGYVTLNGWIQTHATIEALVDGQKIDTLRCILGIEPVLVETYTGPAATGWASGAPYHVAARARFELDLPQGKQAVYRESIAAAMLDLVAAIRDPEWRMLISTEDARRALALALAVTAAAETGASVPC